MPSVLKNQLSSLLQYLSESLDVPESRYKEAEERYQGIGRWLCRNESTAATFRPEIYPQGSFRLGTVIKPISENEEYDIDLVCELALSKDQLSQKQLKDLVGHEIKAYALARNMASLPEEGRRCWTLNYADGAQFHMDILPAIPDGEAFRRLLKFSGITGDDYTDIAIAITDNTVPNYGNIDDDWPQSNPKGYAEWFKDRMKTQFDFRRELLAKSIKAKVEDIPDYRVKTPLQRAVQILKRHRDIMFAEDQDNKPISIIITTLAAHAYENEADLLDALGNIVDKMPGFIQWHNGIAWVPNPVNPLENFADMWAEHPEREQNFRRWLQQVHVDINEALQKETIQSAGRSLEKRFGNRPVSEALQNLPHEFDSVHGLMAGSAKSPSRFTVAHRHQPRWPIQLKSFVKIKGHVKQNDTWYEFSSDTTPLPKHCDLWYEAETDVPRPFDVYWQIVNTGTEAERSNGLRGEILPARTAGRGGLTQYESTLYTGMHWIECFIVKNGICVARSGEFVVNIE